jgi:hypothetical protein
VYKRTNKTTQKGRHNFEIKRQFRFFVPKSVRFSSKDLRISIYDFSIKTEAFELRYAQHARSKTRVPSTLLEMSANVQT